jgi:hypothetical protein
VDRRARRNVRITGTGWELGATMPWSASSREIGPAETSGAPLGLANAYTPPVCALNAESRNQNGSPE